MGFLGDLMAWISKIVKWLGIFGILKVLLLVFGAGALVFVLHFAWVFIWDIFHALIYTWQHRQQVFTTK